MKLSDKIAGLIQSVPAYRVHKNADIPYSTANRLKNGHIKIENLTLETAEKIGAYADIVLK